MIRVKSIHRFHTRHVTGPGIPKTNGMVSLLSPKSLWLWSTPPRHANRIGQRIGHSSGTAIRSLWQQTTTAARMKRARDINAVGPCAFYRSSCLAASMEGSPRLAIIMASSFLTLQNRLTQMEEEETESTTARQQILLQDSPLFSSLLHQMLDYLQWLWRSFWNTLAFTLRTSEIALRLSPMIVLTPASMLMHRYYSNQLGWTRNFVADFAWWYFTTSMQALGPCFVKLCQWIATRRDMVPPHVCDRLGHLHDNGIPHAWKHTHQLLSEAFDDDYQDKGLHVQEIIGCGSAAQVYRAKLMTIETDTTTSTTTNQSQHELQQQQQQQHKEGIRLEQSHNKRQQTQGRRDLLEVAVKVLHPKMDWLVQRDLKLMDTIANFLHSLPIEYIRMVNLPRATANFGYNLQRQTDLREEARNLQQFRHNFYRDNPDDEEHSLVLFPRPIDGWTSRQVMVEELFLDNVQPISAFLKDESEQGLAIRKELGNTLLRAFLKMVFLDNFVHADLHPGNCLVVTQHVPVDKSLLRTPMQLWERLTGYVEETVDDNHKSRIRRKIVFLDAGIATSLSPDDQRNLRELFRAVILNKGYEAGQLMVERAKYERCSQVPGGVEAFSRGIETLVTEFHDNRKHGLSLGVVRIGSLLGRVLDLCRIHGVEIDPAMASVVVSTLVLEGLGRSLDPNLNLIDFAVPFVLGGGRV